MNCSRPNFAGISCLLASMLLAGFMCGCDGLGYIGYLLAPPEKTVTVPAEYEGLVDKTVAVVIYADQRVQYEYPYARLELASVINAELRKHVEGVSVIDPRRVIKYQDENAHWDATDKTSLGTQFGADMVLYVILERYTMAEPGSISLYRGQVSAQARVYEVAMPESAACVWRGDEFEVVYPEDAPVGELGQDDSKVRYETNKRFGQLLAGRFYDREVPAQ